MSTTTSDNISDDDVPHVNPYDWHLHHRWFFEPHTRKGNILTQDGATQIKIHAYQPGAYTMLDLTLNPIWTKLTELLPITLAPNLVTLYGGFHCLFAYLMIWYYAPNLIPASDEKSPFQPWMLLVNAWCLAAYYTLDCMDGKQARRTNSSSPVGQLFDHGLDCMCLLAHLSMVQAWAQLSGAPTEYHGGGAPWYFGLQATLQFSFFVAQWEEYYTGVLPHATGQIGVTEVSYGMAAASFLNALFMSDLSLFYSTSIETILPFLSIPRFVKDSVLLPIFGFETLQTKHVFCLGWFTMMTMLVLLSIQRVLAHLALKKNGKSTWQLQGSALLKLASPLAIALCPFFLPHDILYSELRFISLSVGLAMCLVTIKMIVFSMAKQAYASVQGDALVVLGAAAWSTLDARWKPPGMHLLWQLATLYYVVRMSIWIRAVLRQLCDRLDIELFRLKVKKE
ncbi:hypothetical protein MPSEU_000731500 [Mayamaea pseudoterrestris]|nr:hypothetical protein MPSEU_000731500 [Mayamaea pseudoterrestris]